LHEVAGFARNQISKANGRLYAAERGIVALARARAAGEDYAALVKIFLHPCKCEIVSQVPLTS
jgi:hypothetical protein